jgi:DNA-binding Xre family transcriptional regulator
LTSNLAEALPELAGRKLRALPDPDPDTVLAQDRPGETPARSHLVVEDGLLRVSTRPQDLEGPFLPVPVEYMIDGTRLRAARRREDASIKLLAEFSGVSGKTIGRLESQVRARCRTATLIQLCNALSILPADLGAAPCPFAGERIAV